MEIPGKAVLTIVLASAIVGGYIEKQFMSSSVTKDTITKDNDIVTIIKEKNNKDGSSEKNTTIIDKSKENEQIVTKTVTIPTNWVLQGGIGIDKQLSTVYTVSISRRILGPIFLGVWGSTQQSVGASLGVQF